MANSKASNRVAKVLNQLTANTITSCNENLGHDVVELSNGSDIPKIAIGTYVERARLKFYRDDSTLSQQQIFESKQEDIQDGKTMELAVLNALKHGYRHVDCAEMYRTEYAVGRALNKYFNSNTDNIKRENVWITTKIETKQRLRTDAGIRNAIDKSLKDLQIDYVDAFLIHSPHSCYDKGQRGQDVVDIYKILHEYKKQGKIKSVGVSNFGIEHLKTLERLCPDLPLPIMNQIEVHCFLFEKELINYCLNKGIMIEAYCPLARHHQTVINCKLLKELSKKYNKTYAQIMIKYLQQTGFIVITKTVKLHRLIENGNIYDFKISDYDMKRLNTLKKHNIRVSWNPLKEPWDI